MIKLAFSRELRLLTPINFIFVFKHPLRVGTPQMTMLSRLNNLGYARIGLNIAKRHVKYAHDRNRIKRLIRENFRKRQYELPSMDFVMVAKKGIANLDNYALTKMLEKLWQHNHY